ncbi:MAG: Fe-Mn family superoxide dismutase [Steroidobacteraceae bacterium]
MNPSLDRRLAIQSLAMAGAGVATTALSQAAATAPQTPALPPAFAGNTTLKPLAFDPAKLDGLSEKLIRSHWENNYGGSVRTLAAVRKQLAEALANKDTPAWLYNDIKREHLLRTGSVVLHEYYFDNLGGNGQAGAGLRKAVGDAFGSFDAWETEYRRIANGLGGGSGWVVLGFNTHLRQLENYWLADHAHGPAATLPLLVMDMYEHSYQMDFGAAAARYIDAFFRNIQWDAVQARLEKAQRA